MLFSRVIVNTNYDVDSIIKFHDLLSTEFTDLEIIWRLKNKVVGDIEQADNVKIVKDGKLLFSHNKNNNNPNATLVMSRCEGKEAFVVKSFKDVGFSIPPPSFAIATLCIIGYILLVFFVALSRPEFIIFLAIFITILVTGTLMYAASSKDMQKSNYTISKISSILIITGLIPSSPSSLLFIPLITALNRKSFYDFAESV